MKEQYLWDERYRPRTIEECILPPALKGRFQEYADRGEVPNMILTGTSGTGKTTVARALCEQVGCDYIIINGSLEGRQIDTLRTKIKSFASAFSFEGKPKVVIIDEADYLNKDSVQPALRAFIEQYSDNCRFIFTCNYLHKLTSHIHSRNTVIEFKATKTEQQALCGAFMKRMQFILKTEGITYKDKVLAALLIKFYPDYRRVLKEMQNYSVSGTIDEGILCDIVDIDGKNLIAAMKADNYKQQVDWVVNNVEADPVGLIRQIYDTLVPVITNPRHAVVILADYQYKANFAVDHEINMNACLSELISACKFK